MKKTLSIAKRLYLQSLALLAGMMLIGGFAFYALQQTNMALNSVYEDRAIPLADLGQMRFNLSEMHYFGLQLVDLAEKGDTAAIAGEIEKVRLCPSCVLGGINCQYELQQEVQDGQSILPATAGTDRPTQSPASRLAYPGPAGSGSA